MKKEEFEVEIVFKEKEKSRNHSRSLFIDEESGEKATIDKGIILDSNLSVEARFLLIYSLQMPFDYYFTRKTYTDAFGWKDTKIAKITKELKENYYLTIHQAPNYNGSGFFTKYRFYTGRYRGKIIEKLNKQKESNKNEQ